MKRDVVQTGTSGGLQPLACTEQDVTPTCFALTIRLSRGRASADIGGKRLLAIMSIGVRGYR